MSKSRFQIVVPQTHLILITALGCACNQRADESTAITPVPGVTAPNSDNQIEYDVITGSEMLMRAVGLCHLVTGYTGGAGLYRVAKMIGVSENDGAHTYINLELLEPWSPNAPGNPVARIGGGPEANGVTAGFDVDLRQGEEVGLLLIAPTDENKGFYRIFTSGVFHNVGDGYTNGQLYSQHRASSAELGAAITAAVAKSGSPDCPDVLPDAPPEPPDAAGDVIGPILQGQPVSPEDAAKL